MDRSPKIRVALAGVGNCASALVQGLEYYRDRGRATTGLMEPDIGGYAPGDIEVVAAFDVDSRKVGKRLSEAVFAPPNCAQVFCPDLTPQSWAVSMGPVLDGWSEHLRAFSDQQRILLSEEQPCEVASVLRSAKVDVLVLYLPVGSTRAATYYAEACLEAGVALVNCIPVFLASDAEWAKKFRDRGLPLVGDDIKSQMGATILHRSLARMFTDRGVGVARTYQLNTGGNTDFLNMLERSRLVTKKLSKTESVVSQLQPAPGEADVHIGPSDYVPWQKDNKVAFIRMEGQGFGGLPIEVELRLSVQDSPNSAGVVIDAIRCARLGLDRGLAGPLEAACACYMKRPPRQMAESEALAANRAFLSE